MVKPPPIITAQKLVDEVFFAGIELLFKLF